MTHSMSQPYEPNVNPTTTSKPLENSTTSTYKTTASPAAPTTFSPETPYRQTIKSPELEFVTIYGKQYHLHNMSDNWFHALSYCSGNDLDLVSIQSKQENQAIFEYIHSLNFDLETDIWTSGTTLGQYVGAPLDSIPDSYYWMINNEKFSFTGWAPLNPTNNVLPGAGREQCIILSLGDGGVREDGWRDVVCAYDKPIILCEARN